MPKLSELEFDVYLNKLKDEVADESDKVEVCFKFMNIMVNHIAPQEDEEDVYKEDEDKAKVIAFFASIISSDSAGKAKKAAKEAQALADEYPLYLVPRYMEAKFNAIDKSAKKVESMARYILGILLEIENISYNGKGEEGIYYKEALKKFNATIAGGKRKTKDKNKKDAKKPVVSQKKQSIYKEILRKQMKIYKMPDSCKEYVKYKGELLHISDYKSLMKQKAMAKPKAKPKK